MKINKIIHQVWIGPLDPPTKWLDTWKKYNPGWKYILWDNKKVFGRKWKNQWMIDEYVRKYNEDVKGKGEDGRDIFISAQGATFRGDKATGFAWHVIADIIRYEILYEYGGFMPGADAECIKNIDYNFKDHELYIVNTGHLFTEHRKKLENKELTEIEKLKYERYHPLNASPVMACKKGHWFLEKIIKDLSKVEHLGEAVDTTGNVFMGKMIEKYQPEAKVMKYLRDYGTGIKSGKEGDFSIHHSGTTNGVYHRGRLKELDLVYPSKDSWALKYSIRSAAENIEHRNIVIVGKKPKWAKNIIHIPYTEKHRGSGKEKRNVASKILKACNNKKVSDIFLLMNDDFFFTKQYEPKIFYKGRLRHAYRKPGGPKKQQAETLSLLGKWAKDYEVHCPMEIEKKNIKFLEKRYDIKNKYLLRSLYGNYFNLRGEQVEDFKTSKWRDRAMFSTNDRIERSKQFRDYIKRRFPNKSKYEK
jgi:hypothetical protein